MSRVDVPTLKCDRCGYTTQDLTAMAAFRKVTSPTMSDIEVQAWDFCPACWSEFQIFLSRGVEVE